MLFSLSCESTRQSACGHPERRPEADAGHRTRPGLPAQTSSCLTSHLWALPPNSSTTSTQRCVAGEAADHLAGGAEHHVCSRTGRPGLRPREWQHRDGGFGQRAGREPAHQAVLPGDVARSRTLSTPGLEAIWLLQASLMSFRAIPVSNRRQPPSPFAEKGKERKQLSSCLLRPVLARWFCEQAPRMFFSQRAPSRLETVAESGEPLGAPGPSGTIHGWATQRRIATAGRPSGPPSSMDSSL